MAGAVFRALEVCLFRGTVVEFGSAMLTSFRVAVTGLRMPRTHFFVAGAVLVSQNIENRISYWEADVKVLWRGADFMFANAALSDFARVGSLWL